MHALKGLAQPLAGGGAHVACATRLRLRQAFSRTLRSQKEYKFVRWVQNVGTLRYRLLACMFGIHDLVLLCCCLQDLCTVSS